MNATASTDETLRVENAALRARLEEAEEMLCAIRAGEVDALVVETSAGPQLFTLQGVDAEQNRMRGEMLAQVSDAVIATDLDQHVTFVNASAERQLGVRASEVLGHALADIYIEQWENPAAKAGMWADLHERGECRCELIHHMQDGSELQVEKVISTLRAPDGTPNGYVAVIRDVTCRIKLEQEKSELLRLLDTLLTLAPVGFVFIDRDLRFVRINERLAEMNGLSVAAHLGRSAIEILPTLGATLREVTARILATGQPVLDHEFTGETPGVPGTSRYWNESWYPVCDERGEIMGFGGVVEEITQRKQAEAALRLLNERFDVAVKCSRAVLWQQDRELRFTWLHNPPPGIDGSDAVGKRDEDLLERAEDAAVIVAMKREVIRSGVGVRHEFSPQIQGVRHCFKVLMEPLRDAAGLITGLTGAAVDITARMQAEAVTKVSEVRYRRLFESAKDGILILDAHAATITHANPFIAELLGYSPEEMLGKELWQMGLFQDVEASKDAMQELQEKGYIRYEDLPLETKAGRRINVEFISNLYGEGGEVVIQCNIRNISDRKRLEESLRQHAADLSETDRRKDEFLATLAHELRNPLAPMRNGLQIMKLPEVDAGTVEMARSMIERQVEQMTRLIDDLMDVSRINQGKIQLQKTRMPLADAVRNAIDTSRPLIDAQGHELVVNVPPHPIYVDGDLTRLSQVFANLLNNSAKYTDRGGHIRLTVERQGSDAVVSVADNGVGIRADMLARVFDMFAQIDSSLEKSKGGLGIGLNIVKRLVEMHGGSITAESGGPGMGSTLTVRLPVLIEKPKTQGPPDLSSEPMKITACRILVVDDNRDAAMSLAMLLKIGGHDTQVAHDGVEAVAKAADFKPDMVLLDIGLPKMNGYDACRAIREQPHCKDIVIVALTGWGQDEDRRKSSEAGFNGHLVKPVDHAALMKLLSELHVVSSP